MSYKALELQIALPRTFEAGKMLTDMQQRGLIAQTQLKAEQTASEERKRWQIEKANAKSKGYFSRMGSGNEGEAAFKHPFKGNEIDYTR